MKGTKTRGVKETLSDFQGAFGEGFRCSHSDLDATHLVHWLRLECFLAGSMVLY